MKCLILILSLLTAFTVNAQTTAIPDSNFEQELINLGLDGAIDGQVLTANIDTLTVLVIWGKGINDLTGIQDFSNLETLTCGSNNLTTLNLTQNTALKYLWCTGNQLTSIDVTQNLMLTELRVGTNALTNLDVTQNSILELLDCNSTWFVTNLDVSQNAMLTFLDCSNNQLSSLDVTQNTQLTDLHCHTNQLTSLNVAQNSSLAVLACFKNQFIELDLSQNSLLSSLTCYDNFLTCLNVKNGNNASITNPMNFIAANNPSLTCIEVDNVTFSTTNWTLIDAGVSFSTNCANPCSTFGVNIEENFWNKLCVYPNPTTKNISIDLKETRQNLTATLTNNLGQIILSKKYSSTNFITLEIDAPKGIYFLQLESNGEVITKKIIRE